jgi:hypothetical protein
MTTSVEHVEAKVLLLVQIVMVILLFARFVRDWVMLFVTIVTEIHIPVRYVTVQSTTTTLPAQRARAWER